MESTIIGLEKFKPKLIKAIRYHYDDAKIFLFGSWAQGTNRPNSDIDIAVDIGTKIDFYERDRMRITIENLDIPNTVDLIDLHNVSQEFKEHIMKEAIEWKR